MPSLDNKPLNSEDITQLNNSLTELKSRFETLNNTLNENRTFNNENDELQLSEDSINAISSFINDYIALENNYNEITKAIENPAHNIEDNVKENFNTLSTTHSELMESMSKAAPEFSIGLLTLADRLLEQHSLTSNSKDIASKQLTGNATAREYLDLCNSEAFSSKLPEDMDTNKKTAFFIQRDNLLYSCNKKLDIQTNLATSLKDKATKSLAETEQAIEYMDKMKEEYNISLDNNDMRDAISVNNNYYLYQDKENIDTLKEELYKIGTSNTTSIFGYFKDALDTISEMNKDGFRGSLSAKPSSDSKINKTVIADLRETVGLYIQHARDKHWWQMLPWSKGVKRLKVAEQAFEVLKDLEFHIDCDATLLYADSNKAKYKSLIDKYDSFSKANSRTSNIVNRQHEIHTETISKALTDMAKTGKQSEVTKLVSNSHSHELKQQFSVKPEAQAAPKIENANVKS